MRGSRLLVAVVVVAAGTFVGASAAWVPAGGASAAASSTITFTSAELKTSGTTPAFTRKGPWTMQWNYHCATTGTATFLVAVNQPSGDVYTDNGPNETGASGSGTDHYFDTGSFTLTVASGCTWTITMAPAQGDQATTPLSLSSGAVGESGSTEGFVVGGHWTLHYSFACSGLGATTGSFVVSIQSATGEPNSLAGPVSTAHSGTGTTSYTTAGTYNLVVSSVCSWTIDIEAPTAYTRIYGATADATAADELEHQFEASTGSCPGTTGTRPVVLATDATYPDALASAYLARSLGTGLLLTKPAGLSAPATAAIAAEGITRVEVVGGPLAVSTAVVTKLEQTPVTRCGGGATSGGTHVTVTRISGSTQYTTAERIAQTPPATKIGVATLSSAYGGTNASGGTGRYNATSGTGSAAPASSTPLPTAILSTGTGFEDAEAASTLAYATRLPMLLTTPSSLSSQAASAIGTLGIKQVIVVGGPFAVSDSVVSSLESLDVSVLRVAGTDYTATAVEIADLETAAQPDGFGWTGTGSVTVARGDFYADGLAGAVVAADGPGASGPAPMLLTVNPTTVGTPLTSFLKSAGSSGIGGETVTHLVVLGGPFAVSSGAVDAMVSDL